MYILTDSVYDKLNKQLEDDFIMLKDKCDYNTALNERIKIEKAKKEYDQDYIKKMIIDLNFVKSDILKLSTTTDVLKKILNELEETKNNVKFILIHPELTGNEKYQEIKKISINFVPQQDEVIIMSGEYFCCTKRIFDTDNDILLIYLSKTKRCGDE